MDVIESIEFRIPENCAEGRLPPSLGQSIGGSVRRIILSMTDPWVSKIGEWDQETRQREGMSLFTFWRIRRRYDAAETESAQRFLLRGAPIFEPAGEESGTQYDVSGSCERCGAGRQRIGPLVVDRRVLRRRLDLAVSIAGDEWIVSSKIADAIRERAISGVRLEPVRTSGSCADANLEKIFSIDIEPPRLEVTTDTKFGLNPFDEDPEGQYRCKRGHVVGLNLLSELYLTDVANSLPDLAMTSVFVGNRSGLLVPYRLMTMSRRFTELLQSRRVRGLTIEIARQGSAAPFAMEPLVA